MRTDQRRILRLSLGVAVAMFVSQAIAWPVSYLAPLVTAAILTLPIVRPPARLFLVIAAALSISVYSGYLLLPFLLHQKIAGVLLLAIILFHSFYFTARGGQPVVGLLATIGLTLAVAIGTVSVDALQIVSAGTAMGAFAGAGIAAFAHLLLPDPVPPARKPAEQPSPTDSAEAARLAFRALSVVLPVVMWLISTSSSAAYAAVMIKVAAMGQESTQQGVRDAAKSLLLSTLIGGLAAVVLWELLRIWPALIFYVLLMALAAMFLGAKVFSGEGLSAQASTWSYGLLTLIILLAPAAVDSQTGADATSRFYDRLIMLALASVYGVVATGVFDALFRPASRRQSMRDPAANNASR